MLPKERDLSMVRNRSFPVFVGALITTVSFAACGGGGSTSSIMPGGGGTTTSSHAKLTAGFAGVGRGGSSAQRRTMSLSGALVPIADFIVPQNVTKGQPPIAVAGATAVAYYDPTTGSVPSPLPSITWTQSGIPVTLSAPQSPVTISGASIAGEDFAAAPTVDGQGTIIGTASNGDTIQLTLNSYKGAGISTLDPAGIYGYGFYPCLTFAANGTVTSSASGDICIQAASNGPSSVIAALGGLLVQKTIDQVTAADAANLPSSSSTITGPSIVPGTGTYTIIAHTSAGGLVKWEPAVLVGTNVATGALTDLYGPYRVSTGSNWDF